MVEFLRDERQPFLDAFHDFLPIVGWVDDVAVLTGVVAFLNQKLAEAKASCAQQGRDCSHCSRDMTAGKEGARGLLASFRERAATSPAPGSAAGSAGPGWSSPAGAGGTGRRLGQGGALPGLPVPDPAAGAAHLAHPEALRRLFQPEVIERPPGTVRRQEVGGFQEHDTWLRKQQRLGHQR